MAKVTKIFFFFKQDNIEATTYKLFIFVLAYNFICYKTHFLILMYVYMCVHNFDTCIKP